MRYGLKHDNITQAYYGESSGDSTRTHFRFAGTFVTAAFITPGGPLALLTRQRRRDSKADTLPCLDKFLPAEAARTGDPHALREYLVHDILQHALLVCDIERQCLARSQGRRVWGL
jgi:hypothetical protein